MPYAKGNEEKREYIVSVFKEINANQHDIFVKYLMNHMNFDYEGELTEKNRREACELFVRIMNIDYLASLPTIRRWFGIHGQSFPSREQIYYIAYMLKLGEEELSGFLQECAGNPGIQYNDYHEVIFLYGLIQQLSWDEVLQMCEDFEVDIPENIIFLHTHSTNQLMEQFQAQKVLSKDKFMEWMYGNAEYFKGYSKTTLDYVENYKRYIVSQVKKDAIERRDALLAETDFENWKKGKNLFGKKSYEEMVQSYIYTQRKKQKNAVTTDILDSIGELNRLAKLDEEAGHNLISEVFGKGNKEVGLPNLSGKHLSDVFHVAIQKERETRARLAYGDLKNMEDDEKCPESIVQFIRESMRGSFEGITVPEARESLLEYIKEHKRRTRFLHRQDMLPFIFCVAQMKYMESINNNMEFYVQKDARENFENLANATLTTCGMSLLNEKYVLDHILLSCFQAEEMYSYGELLEILEEL